MLAFVQTYHNDTLNGPYKSYHPSGRIKIDGQYSNGLFDGKWTYFDQFGRIVGEGDFNKGSGSQTAFFSNGKKKQVIHYKNNQKHGREEFYNADGSLSKVNIYKNGNFIEERPK